MLTRETGFTIQYIIKSTMIYGTSTVSIVDGTLKFSRELQNIGVCLHSIFLEGKILSHDSVGNNIKQLFSILTCSRIIWRTFENRDGLAPPPGFLIP